MYAGRVVEEGPAEQVFAAPAAPVLRRAVRGVPAGRRPGRAVRAGRAARRPARPAQRCRADARSRPRCPRAAEVCLPAEPELATYAEGRAAACVRIGEPDRSPVEPVETAAADERPHDRGAVGDRTPGRVRDPHRPGGARPRRRRPGRRAPARSWRWSASPAPARRRWPARLVGLSEPAAGEVRVGRASRWTAPRRGLQGAPAPRPARAPGPAGALNPRHTRLRVGGRGPPGPQAGRRRQGKTETELVAARPGLGRAAAARGACSCATRTSSPAASGSAC